MEEALIHGQDAVIAHLDATKVLQPSVGALDFPAPRYLRSLRLSSKRRCFLVRERSTPCLGFNRWRSLSES